MDEQNQSNNPTAPNDPMQAQQPSNEKWVCMGTCQAEISEEQHAGGLTNCGAEGCTLKGQPLVKGHKDASGQNVPAEA